LLYRADHADNCERFVLVKYGAVIETAPQGTAAGPVAVGEGLIDHADALFALIVGIFQKAPPEQRDIQRPPVGAHNAVSVVVLLRTAVCDLHTLHRRDPAATVSAKGRQVANARESHSGLVPNGR
jgi:hypothetical protein